MGIDYKAFEKAMKDFWPKDDIMDAMIYGKFERNIGVDMGTPLHTYKNPKTSEAAQMTEYCNYHGKRCKILSKDYQTGIATIQAQDVTGPYTLTVKLSDLEIENPRAGNKCTCGVDAVNGGRHSDWCDKFYKGE